MAEDHALIRKTYTVLGLWLDGQPVVAGVIEGEHPAVGRHLDHQGAFAGRWATFVQADDPRQAEEDAVLQLLEGQ